MRQVLTIAGSDSGGGAGVQADLKTFHANGTFGMSVITSVTAQNTQEVTCSHDLPIEVVEAQIDAVFDDFDVSATKTGMLSSASIVEAVARRLSACKVENLVVDPVMISKSGFALLREEAVASVKGSLLPLASIVTPNLHEAELLAGTEIVSLDDVRDAAARILEFGSKAVLIKGGHLESEPDAVDLLWDGEKESLFRGERIQTQNTHGTGCTYSAAIAAGLGKGQALHEAVGIAKVYITEAIRNSLDIGEGHGPTNHFFILSRST